MASIRNTQECSSGQHGVNILRQWQDPRFLTSGIPIRRTSLFYARLHTGVWRSNWGLQDFGYLNSFRRQTPYQLSGAQSGYLCPTALGPSASGPPGDGRHGQFDLPLLRLTVNLFHNRYIPGCLNVRADHLSRPNQPISTNWYLHPEIVERIFRVWGTPEVDMFATLSNSHLPRVMSPIPEPRALAVDALSQDWQGRSMYILVSQGGRGNSRRPWWPTQSCFPHLLPD